MAAAPPQLRRHRSSKLGARAPLSRESTLMYEERQIERRQQRSEFVGSACGKDRECDCNAPALARAEKVLAAAERKRTADRERAQAKRDVARRAFEKTEELPHRAEAPPSAAPSPADSNDADPETSA